MKPSSEIDRLIISRIREGDSRAWEQLIERYEGRLLAFVENRLSRRSASEDIVQETLVGFLNSLPNYDGQRSLESYLFSICAYKITDHLRREGRRPAIPLSAGSDSSGDWQLEGGARPASSIARSTERRRLEEDAIAAALAEQFTRWQQRGDWTKLKCIEMLFVRGISNKKAAHHLDLTEQQVANYKFDFLSRLRNVIKRQNLSADVFPELYDEA